MKVVIYSQVLNNHQSVLADSLWAQTFGDFTFVELANLPPEFKKGDSRDYKDCPYLLRSWESEENYQKAMDLALSADCCIFGGVLALPFLKERMKLNLLSFDMSERWLKQGIINLFSPTIRKMFISYWKGRWGKKQLYKLACSAYAAGDHYRLGMYKNKCFKWGYFTRVEGQSNQKICLNNNELISIMWCSRYLALKHPELPILLADRLRRNGYKFTMDMYGEGPLKGKTQELVRSLELEGTVSFWGNKPNACLMDDMKRHDIFLFTSDKNEGWGAVANESMANGCALVAAEAIGSIPYLVRNGENGFIFESPKTHSRINNPDYHALESLYGRVAWLLDHPSEMRLMQENAMFTMQYIWSPSNAAKSIIQLINDLMSNRNSDLFEGPCSKA